MLGGFVVISDVVQIYGCDVEGAQICRIFDQERFQNEH